MNLSHSHSQRPSGNVSYMSKVLGYSPVGYWPLNESSGLVAYDISGNGNHAVYTAAVALADADTPFGMKAPFFDPAAGTVQVVIPENTFTSVFNGNEGAIVVAAKVVNAGFWTDGVSHQVYRFQVDADNEIYSRKEVSDGLFRGRRIGSANSDIISNTGVSTTDWFVIGLDWSIASDYFRMYWNGVDLGSPHNSLDNYVGVLNVAIIGARSANSVEWHGWISNMSVFGAPLGPSGHADLATA